MSSREHRERLVREGFEAFNRGDAEAVLAVLDPAVESHVGPSLANTGTWHGHAGFLEMLRIWGEAFATQRNTLVSLSFPDDDHVIAVFPVHRCCHTVFRCQLQRINDP